jgi:hypothetical protein
VSVRFCITKETIKGFRVLGLRFAPLSTRADRKAKCKCSTSKSGTMLYIVGLGLHDERDISLRGLDAVRRCEKIYLEAYTSLLTLGLGESSTATLVCAVS